MIRLSRLPEEVARLLAPLKPSFSYRHYAVFCWLVVAHLVCFEKATLQGLARYIPSRVAAWHSRSRSRTPVASSIATAWP